MSTRAYARVLLLFAGQRVVELIYSRRNERAIRRRKPATAAAGDTVFRWIAAVNVALFTVPIVERSLRRRPPPTEIAAIGWLLALAAVTLRLSALLALREAWNVRALVPEDLRVIDRGPYRLIRHPNYVALALEFLGLPLMGGAYLTAVGLSAVNGALLARRIVEEEAMLMRIPAYRERMGKKPRFIPRLVTGR